MDRYKNLKLEYQLSFSLYAGAKEVVRLHEPLLKSLGITYTQYLCLLALWEKDNIMIKELCEKIMLDTGTVTPLLKKLESAQLIEKKRKKGDERAVVVCLTKEGLALRDKAVHIPFRSICNMGISIEEAVALKKNLDHMLENLRAKDENNTT